MKKTKGENKMPYTQLLNQIIDNSGLTLKEIAENCKEYGQDITASYISTLRNDKNNRAPSDDVSIAIAKACKIEKGFENILAVEAYIDTAPKEIKDLIELFKDITVNSTIGMVENKVTTQQRKELRKAFDTMPMSKFIIEITSDKVISSIKKNKGTLELESKNIFTDTNLTITQKIKPVGFTVADNGMYPLIAKGDEATVELKNPKEYKTGDIILLKKKGKKVDFIARKIVVGRKQEFTLIPINNDYAPETVNLNDILIMGVITQYIRKI